MIHYRLATQADMSILATLRIDFLKEVMKITDPPADITANLETYFSVHLQQGDYINWLAVDDNKIVAMAGISFYSLPPNFLNPTGNRAYILNVYTLPGYRRQGISRQLFQHLMDEAASKGIMQVSLHTTQDAAALYSQFGFEYKANEMVWGKHI